MKRVNKEKKENQLPLGLHYTGFRIFDVLRYRVTKFFIVLDYFTFWRSPILWLTIFINAVAIFFVVSRLLAYHHLPPTIPLIYYYQGTQTSLVHPSDIYYVLGGHLLLQCIALFFSARIFYRQKYMSVLILVTSVIASLLLYITLIKSIILTLPPLS